MRGAAFWQDKLFAEKQGKIPSRAFLTERRRFKAAAPSTGINNERVDDMSISRGEFEKLRFCKQYWDTNGGDAAKRPYWDEIGAGSTGKQQRVYLNTLWYGTWEKFAPAAELALNAAVVRYDAIHGEYVKEGTSYRISGEPHYLIEPQKWPGLGKYSVWINALCPSEEQFNFTLSEAREKIERMKNGDVSRPGFRVSSLFEPPAPAPLYPSEWCQDADGGTVGELLRRKGIRG